MLGTSAGAAITASRSPNESITAPATRMRTTPASPSAMVHPSARRTSGPRASPWPRLVTATPSWPNRRARIVTVRTTSTKRPRPDGSRKRLWITTSAKATGVETPRNSSVSTVFRPTLRAPGISFGRTRFGVTGGAASMPGEGRSRVVATVIAARLQPMPTVLVDAENVRRSLWPNIPRAELEQRCREWGRVHGHDVIVVWEGAETADDRIAFDARRLPPPVWVVTSDRELRARVAASAEHIVGGGSFA